MTITFRLVKSNRHGTKLRVEKKRIYNFKTGRWGKRIFKNTQPLIENKKMFKTKHDK